MKTGIELIAEERERQVTQEGWSAEHDDRHGEGELSSAAASYAEYASVTAFIDNPNATRFLGPPKNWPWERKWWKPSGTIRDLVKAPALIAAEIDRLQRLKRP